MNEAFKIDNNYEEKTNTDEKFSLGKKKNGSIRFRKLLEDEVTNTSIYTSCHGLPFLIRSKFLVIKILWWLLIITSLGLCGYNLYLWIDSYMKYPVVSFKNVYIESPTLFPAVTICNLNPLSSAYASSLLNKTLPSDFDINNNWTLYNEYKTKLSIQAMNPDFGDENRQKLSDPISDILIKCKYNDIECNYSDFTWYYSYDYGNCYTFNSGFSFNTTLVNQTSIKTKVKTPINYAYKTGNKYGLYLELFATSASNNIPINEYFGFIMFIHNQTDKPETAHAVLLNTGTLANIVLKKSFIYNTPYPYNSCKDLDSSDYNKIFYNTIKNTDYLYQQEDCFNLCLQKIIIESCGCYSLEYLKLGDSKPCLTDLELNCSKVQYLSFIDQDENQLCQEYCPLECDSSFIDLLISLNGFPSNGYSKVLQGKNFGKNMSNQNLINNTIAVNIYFNDFMYTSTMVSPKYGTVDFLVNFGSILGIFTGVSYLTFFEIIDLIVNITLGLCVSKTKKISPEAF